ncbi:MAG: hypothetical protein AMS24_03540 [Chlamydiae bacterium SM23_39]|nr:MAG: hypothetical protein AMS24_03540 [Chlamydiae bacterium SM23_39]
MDEKFLNLKENILNNIYILKINYNNLVENGMMDPNSNLYNKIDYLIDELDAADTFEALSEIINTGKNIESQLESFFILKGQSTISLTWPII